jgi:gliding motility-associated-like protein
MVMLNLEDLSCFGESDGQITAVASGGTGPYTYAWSNGATTNRISNLNAGNFTVTVTDGAGASVNAPGTLNEPDTLRVTVNTTPSPNNIEGTATAVVTGGTSPYRYSWTDANRSTTRVVIALPQGDIRVIVTDDNGCTASAGANITPDNRECFTAVPVMSPNGDGRNDILNIACVLGLDNELEVYNRHGELVFEASNYANNWEGVDSNGEVLPDGAYYWVIRVRRDGILEQHLGHLTILSTLN